MGTDDEFTGPVKLGNPTEFTFKELAERVIDLTLSNFCFEGSLLPSDDPIQHRCDISLAKEKLGWESSVQLDEGLEATISHFKEVSGD